MKNKSLKESLGILLMLGFIFTVVWCGKSEERAANRIERQVERTLKKQIVISFLMVMPF